MTMEVKLAYQVAYIENRDGEHENEAQDEGDDLAYSSSEEQKALAIGTQVHEQQGIFPTEIGITIRNCQEQLRLEKQSALRQTTISDHFHGN